MEKHQNRCMCCYKTSPANTVKKEIKYKKSTYIKTEFRSAKFSFEANRFDAVKPRGGDVVIHVNRCEECHGSFENAVRKPVSMNSRNLIIAPRGEVIHNVVHKVYECKCVF